MFSVPEFSSNKIFVVPGISESLANTLKQKELLMERIRQYKEISKKPMTKPTTIRRESTVDTKVEIKKVCIQIIFFKKSLFISSVPCEVSNNYYLNFLVIILVPNINRNLSIV